MAKGNRGLGEMKKETQMSRENRRNPEKKRYRNSPKYGRICMEKNRKI